VVEISLQTSNYSADKLGKVTFCIKNTSSKSVRNLEKIVEYLKEPESSASTSLAKFKSLAVLRTGSDDLVGIGLGVTFNSVKSLEGSLNFIGRGQECQFTFFFNASLVVSVAVPSRSMSPPTFSVSLESKSNARKKILLVDDSQICLRIINRIVQNIGYDTELAENGAIAVSILEKRPTDFVATVIDLRMPVLDGLQATSKCRELGITIPFILLTADVENLVDSARDSGVNSVLEKPPGAQDMRRAFESLDIFP
jgi:osomolarity two-component system sensor histidine kinase TcsA